MNMQGSSDFAVFFDSVNVSKLVRSFNTSISTNGEMSRASIEMIYIPSLDSIESRDISQSDLDALLSSIDSVDNMTNVKIFVKNIFTDKYNMVFDGNIRSKSVVETNDGGNSIGYVAVDYMKWLNRTISPMTIPLNDKITNSDRFRWMAQGIDTSSTTMISSLANLEFKGKKIMDIVNAVFSQAIAANKLYYDRRGVGYWDDVVHRVDVMADVSEHLRNQEVLDFRISSESLLMNTIYVFINDVARKMMFEFFQDRDGIIRIKPPFWNQPVIYSHVISGSIIHSLNENSDWENATTRVMTTGGLDNWQEEHWSDIGIKNSTPIGVYVGDGNWAEFRSHRGSSQGSGGMHDNSYEPMETGVTSPMNIDSFNVMVEWSPSSPYVKWNTKGERTVKHIGYAGEVVGLDERSANDKLIAVRLLDGPYEGYIVTYRGMRSINENIVQSASISEGAVLGELSAEVHYSARTVSDMALRFDVRLPGSNVGRVVDQVKTIDPVIYLRDYAEGVATPTKLTYRATSNVDLLEPTDDELAYGPSIETIHQPMIKFTTEQSLGGVVGPSVSYSSSSSGDPIEGLGVSRSDGTPEKIQVTAYCPFDDRTGLNHDGDPSTTSQNNRPGYGTIAVDPARIPYGTLIYVPGYGYGVADDTGGAMVNAPGILIDVYVNTDPEARIWWGRRDLTAIIFYGVKKNINEVRPYLAHEYKGEKVEKQSPVTTGGGKLYAVRSNNTKVMNGPSETSGSKRTLSEGDIVESFGKSGRDGRWVKISNSLSEYVHETDLTSAPPGSSVTSESKVKFYYVDSPQSQRVYREPSRHSEILRMEPRNTVVYQFRKDGDWIKISQSNEEWMHTATLREGGMDRRPPADISGSTTMEALRHYSEFMYNMKNSMVNTCTLTSAQGAPMPWIRPGFNVWVDPIRKDKIYYTQRINHSGSARNGTTTTLNLVHGRTRHEFLSDDDSVFGRLKPVQKGDNIFINEVHRTADDFGRTLRSPSEYADIRNGLKDAMSASKGVGSASNSMLRMLYGNERDSYEPNYPEIQDINHQTDAELFTEEELKEIRIDRSEDIVLSSTISDIYKHGDSSSVIRKIKTALSNEGYEINSINNSFDSNLVSVIRDFQSRNGIHISGIICNATSQALNTIINNQKYDIIEQRANESGVLIGKSGKGTLNNIRMSNSLTLDEIQVQLGIGYNELAPGVVVNRALRLSSAIRRCNAELDKFYSYSRR